MKLPKPPKLCKQKRSDGDLAYVCLNGKKHYLGAFGSPESEEKYLRLISEWAITKKTPSTSKASGITINDLVTAFLEHAKTYYVKNGRITITYTHFVEISSKLNKLYGSLPVNEFSPVFLDILRQRIIDSRCVQKPNLLQKPEPLSRKYVNYCIDRIKQIFKWGVAKDLVKPETHYALCQLSGLLLL